MNDNSQFDGLLFKLNSELQTKTGVLIKNELRPYPRVIHEIKNGSVDFAVMFNSPQAKDIGISVGRVVVTQILLVALKGVPEISSLNEIEGKYVGYLRGSEYGPVFDNNTKLHKVPLNSMDQGISMLLKNRIDAVAGADQTFYYALEQLAISIDEIKPIMVINSTSADLYFSKASKNSHLIKPFKAALKKLTEDGVIHNIFYKNHYKISSSVAD